MAAGGKARRNANGQGGVYRRGDGRWEAKVFVDTPDGRRKRISVYGDSERAALDELGKVLDQQRRGIPTATTTFNRLSDSQMLNAAPYRVKIQSEGK